MKNYFKGVCQVAHNIEWLKGKSLVMTILSYGAVIAVILAFISVVNLIFK